MLSPTDALRRPDPFFDGDDPLLDLDALDALEAPDRLSRDEGRAAAGPDWSWIHPMSDEEPEND
jgi:hypothetical protein